MVKGSGNHKQLWFDFHSSKIGPSSDRYDVDNGEDNKEHDDLHDHVVFDDDDDDDDDDILFDNHNDRMKLVGGTTSNKRYEICELCHLSSNHSTSNRSLHTCGSYDDAEFGQSAHEASIATHMLTCPHRLNRNHDNIDDEDNTSDGNIFFSHFSISGFGRSRSSGGSIGNDGSSSSSSALRICCWRRTLFVVAVLGLFALSATVFVGNNSNESQQQQQTSSSSSPSYGYDQQSTQTEEQSTTEEEISNIPVIVVPEAPSELYDVCTVLDNEDDNNTYKQRCIELCLPGACCLGKENNCFASNPITCQDYLVCPINDMIGIGTTTITTTFDGNANNIVPPTPIVLEDLQELCSSESILTEGGRDVCNELCEGGLCCIGENGDCSTVYHEECQQYVPCHSLWIDNGYDFISSSSSNVGEEGSSPTTPHLPLDVMCGEQNIKTPKGRQQCEDICELGSCCFNGGTCLDTHPFICNEYKSCPVYQNSELSTMTNDEKIVPYPSKPLDVICSESSISSEEGKQECLEECLVGRCCFEEGASNNNCFINNQDTCDSYEICITVLPSSIEGVEDDVVMSPVDALCNVDNLSTPEGREACASICSYGSCCTTEDDDTSSSCRIQHMELCESYNACHLLKDIPMAPDTLEEMCTNASRGGGSSHSHECERLCSVASCCFMEGKDNCQPTNVETCASYEGICDINNNHSGSSVDGITNSDGKVDEVISTTTSEETSPLAFLCSDVQKATKEGYDKCQEECKPAKCCVATDVQENCRDTNPDGCEEYTFYCMDMWEIETAATKFSSSITEEIPSSLSSPMSSICSSTAISTKEGKDKCIKECDHSSCCDADSDAFNCYEQNQEWCNEVLIYCKILD